jgi:hypothetical protein
MTPVSANFLTLWNQFYKEQNLEFFWGEQRGWGEVFLLSGALLPVVFPASSFLDK